MFNTKQNSASYYLKNKEKIKQQRKLKRESETLEEREKRLKFHREYNSQNALTQKKRSQTDEYKFKLYIFAAKRRNYEFQLSFEEFKQLFHGKCIYCGVDDCRGIDRFENKIGYTIDNSRSCCGMCNKMKWKHSTGDFINQCQKIVNNLIV
jgi:hypothetical protein